VKRVERKEIEPARRCSTGRVDAVIQKLRRDYATDQLPKGRGMTDDGER
jgi:hypothetical protein